MFRNISHLEEDHSKTKQIKYHFSLTDHENKINKKKKILTFQTSLCVVNPFLNVVALCVESIGWSTKSASIPFEK